MMEQQPDFYQTIAGNSQAIFRDRDSKFLSYAYPLTAVNEFKEILAGLKKEHPKAAHHCFAYRIGIDGSLYRASDDGEPSGTAGKPILGQIDSRNIVNTAIIVVRYFGGTLLGVPGLINAYKSAAAMALQVIPVVQKQIELKYRLQFDYTVMNDIIRIIKQTGCSIIVQELQLFCVMIIGIPNSRSQEVLYWLKEIKNLQYERWPDEAL